MSPAPAPLRAHYWCNADTSEPVSLAVGGGAAVAFNRPAPGSRRTNQDSAGAVAIGGDSALLAVADGAGGLPKGDRASRAAIHALFRAVREAERSDVARREGILTGFDRANGAVRRLGGAASTLVAVSVVGRTARTYHVGDSTALIVTSRGVVRLQTIDHSPAGYAVEAGEIDASEAMHHDARHVLLNSLGSSTMRIEVSSRVKLGRRDTVVLASDGLFDNLTVDEVADVARRRSLEAVVASLASRARERMLAAGDGEPSKIDDLALIAYRRT